ASSTPMRVSTHTTKAALRRPSFVVLGPAALASRDAVGVDSARERGSRGLLDRPRRVAARVPSVIAALRGGHAPLDVEAAAEGDISRRAVDRDLLGAADVRRVGGDDGRSVESSRALRSCRARVALRAGRAGWPSVTLRADRACVALRACGARITLLTGWA